ncbi:MAG: HEPN domain-containing protein [bacterium]
MKPSLIHLPENKQQELSELASIICEKHNIEMVILFGSYARGDWVEELHEDGFNYKYQSDFDAFIVTETKALANKVESDRQLRDQIRRCIKTPTTLIAHDIDFFNRRLRKGQYFFLDIKKEGVCLYNSGRFELAEEKELLPKEYRSLAQEDFTYWLDRSQSFFDVYFFANARNDYRTAVFALHQATESLYSANLLVLTRYKPNTHDLEKLSGRIAGIDPSFLKVFPQGTEEERKLFELLRKGYVDARYNKNYLITLEELTWLVERVNILRDMTQEVCKKKIESLV